MRNITIEAPRRSGKTRQCISRAKRLIDKGDSVLILTPYLIRIGDNIEGLSIGSTNDVMWNIVSEVDHLILDEVDNLLYHQKEKDLSRIRVNKSTFRIYTDNGNERISL